MFNNLIESQSHRKEFTRRGRFVLATTAAYALFLVCAGVGSIYAYDARLEAQNDDLMVMSWVPPVTAAPVRESRPAQQIHQSSPPIARVDPHTTISQRTIAVSSTNDPARPPDRVGTIADPVPPLNGSFRISLQNTDPPRVVGEDSGCATCNGTSAVVHAEEPAPEPVKRVVPTTRTVPSVVLVSKVLSMPKPAYPIIAKNSRIQGPVNVQILVSESGSVISAHAVSGNPMLVPAATQAALQARFTPTQLNGQAVKIQGVITYNFVLQ